jgi:hypothetical protein
MERDVDSAIIGIDKPATVYVSLYPSGLQSFYWAIIVIAGGNVRMDRMAAMEAFVVDAGSFSGAAKQLHRGQPAVSKIIAQLE